MITAATSFLGNLDALAEANPDAPALRFVSAAGESPWTRGEVRSAAQSLSQELRALVGGARVAAAIVSPNVEHQALGLLGAARAGLHPTIFSHPSVKQATAKYVATIPLLLRAAGVDVLIADGAMADLIDTSFPDHGLRVFRLPQTLSRSAPIGADPPSPDFQFIQYSSGTTGIRKGIRIEERMLMPNLAATAKVMAFSPSDVTVNWLPLYHDMGLVGGLLSPLSMGSTSVIVSPFDWLQRPSLVLELLSRYRGTHCYMPNFAFSMLATRTKESELAGIRLDSVRALFSGGEPARVEAFRQFYDRFSPYGLQEGTFRVGYGMAECVVAVAITPRSARLRTDTIDATDFRRRHLATPATESSTSLTILSCGPPVDDVSVRIANSPPERHAGEVEVSSSSLFSGYLGDVGVDPFTSDGWYRTGDHGYIAEGEIYIAGRLSDMIVVRGENIYPADVEHAVEALAAVKPGRCVAFGVYDEAAGTEALIVAVEPAAPEDVDRLAERVAEHLHVELGILVSDVFVAGPGTLLKSTSGKLSRSKNRELYVAERGRAEQADIDPAVLERCVEAIRRVIGAERVGAHDHLVLGLGFDSLSIVRLADALGPIVPGGISPAQILAAGTVWRLAKRMQSAAPPPEGPSVRISDGALRPLFVFHGLAIPPHAYARLAPRFAGRPVVVLMDPHWGRTSGYFRTLEECAATYLAEVRRIQPRGPYDLLGDCYGGAVAYEVARVLEAQGESTRLAMLGTPGPSRRTWARLRASRLPRLVVDVAMRVAVTSPRLASWAKGALRFRSNPSHALRFFVAVDPEDRNRDAVVRVALPELCNRRLGDLPADEAWQEVAEVILRSGGHGEKGRGISTGVSWRHAMRVDQENEHSLERYRPRAVRTSPTLMVSDVRSAWLHEPWSRYCQSFEHLKLAMSPSAEQTTHDPLLAPENLARYGDRLCAWFTL